MSSTSCAALVLINLERFTLGIRVCRVPGTTLQLFIDKHRSGSFGTVLLTLICFRLGYGLVRIRMLAYIVLPKSGPNLRLQLLIKTVLQVHNDRHDSKSGQIVFLAYYYVTYYMDPK